jgi:hypothetical protein
MLLSITRAIANIPWSGNLGSPMATLRYQLKIPKDLGLNFSCNTDMGQIGHLWMGTTYDFAIYHAI